MPTKYAALMGAAEGTNEFRLTNPAIREALAEKETAQEGDEEEDDECECSDEHDYDEDDLALDRALANRPGAERHLGFMPTTQGRAAFFGALQNMMAATAAATGAGAIAGPIGGVAPQRQAPSSSSSHEEPDLEAERNQEYNEWEDDAIGMVWNDVYDHCPECQRVYNETTRLRIPMTCTHAMCLACTRFASLCTVCHEPYRPIPRPEEGVRPGEEAVAVAARVVPLSMEELDDRYQRGFLTQAELATEVQARLRPADNNNSDDDDDDDGLDDNAIVARIVRHLQATPSLGEADARSRFMLADDALDSVHQGQWTHYSARQLAEFEEESRAFRDGISGDPVSPARVDGPIAVATMGEEPDPMAAQREVAAAATTLQDLRNARLPDINVDWECPICASPYDNDERIPMMVDACYRDAPNMYVSAREDTPGRGTVKGCGHRMCEPCSLTMMGRKRDLNTCPTCRSWIKSYGPDLSLLHDLVSKDSGLYMLLVRQNNKLNASMDPLALEANKTGEIKEKLKAKERELTTKQSELLSAQRAIQESKRESEGWKAARDEAERKVERLKKDILHYAGLTVKIIEAEKISRSLFEDVIDSRLRCVASGAVPASRLGIDVDMGDAQGLGLPFKYKITTTDGSTLGYTRKNFNVHREEEGRRCAAIQRYVAEGREQDKLPTREELKASYIEGIAYNIESVAGADKVLVKAGTWLHQYLGRAMMPERMFDDTQGADMTTHYVLATRAMLVAAQRHRDDKEIEDRRAAEQAALRKVEEEQRAKEEAANPKGKPCISCLRPVVKEVCPKCNELWCNDMHSFCQHACPTYPGPMGTSDVERSVFGDDVQLTDAPIGSGRMWDETWYRKACEVRIRAENLATEPLGVLIRRSVAVMFMNRGALPDDDHVYSSIPEIEGALSTDMEKHKALYTNVWRALWCHLINRERSYERDAREAIAKHVPKKEAPMPKVTWHVPVDIDAADPALVSRKGTGGLGGPYAALVRSGGSRIIGVARSASTAEGNVQVLVGGTRDDLNDGDAVSVSLAPPRSPPSSAVVDPRFEQSIEHPPDTSDRLPRLGIHGAATGGGSGYTHFGGNRMDIQGTGHFTHYAPSTVYMPTHTYHVEHTGPIDLMARANSVGSHAGTVTAPRRASEANTFRLPEAFFDAIGNGGGDGDGGGGLSSPSPPPLIPVPESEADQSPPPPPSRGRESMTRRGQTAHFSSSLSEARERNGARSQTRGARRVEAFFDGVSTPPLEVSDEDEDVVFEDVE